MTPALRELLAHARIKQFPKGQILLYAGDHPSEVFIVKRGVVKLYNIDDNGNEKILHMLKPLAVLPLAYFSDLGTPTRWYYMALTDCEVYVLSKNTLDELMASDWRTAKLLVNCFSEEVRELLVRLDSMGKSNIETKLTIALRYLGAVHTDKGRGVWRRVNFSVNHQLLADFIGMSRESTAIAMKSLADRGVVRYAGGTMLEINFEKLIDRIGEE